MRPRILKKIYVSYSISDYKRHNASTNAWAYKTELGTTNEDEAEKKYHALLAEYIGSETFDFVCVTFSDMFGNKIESKCWQKDAE